MEFEQEIGVRTDDIVVVGWIDRQLVPLNSDGVQSALTEVLPLGGFLDTDEDNPQIKAALLIKHISEKSISAGFEIDEPWYTPVLGGIMIGVDFEPFSDSDKKYALNWMFKYADNSSLPEDFQKDGFFSQERLDTFAAEKDKTRYKLLNHYQARYLVGEDMDFKAGTLVHLKHKVEIGNTKDPARFYDIWGLNGLADIGGWLVARFQGYPANGAFPGIAGGNNSDTPNASDVKTTLRNEGTPDQKALDAFKKLTGHDQGYIWSSVTFFSDYQQYAETTSPSTQQSLTRDPKPSVISQGRINTQVYPTYWMYINGKRSESVQEQASVPSALFPNTDIAQ